MLDPLFIPSLHALCRRLELREPFESGQGCTRVENNGALEDFEAQVVLSYQKPDDCPEQYQYPPHYQRGIDTSMSSRSNRCGVRKELALWKT